MSAQDICARADYFSVKFPADENHSRAPRPLRPPVVDDESGNDAHRRARHFSGSTEKKWPDMRAILLWRMRRVSAATI
jgi:hypothetical protein